MDWSTRRHVLRVYLRNHNWWWKWPLVATTVAVWVGALVLLVAPWDRAGSQEHVDGLPAPTTTDLKTDDGPTDRVSSWSRLDEESRHAQETGTALPVGKAPAESTRPEQEPGTADSGTVDREAGMAEATGPLESRRGDVAEVLDQPLRSSPSTTGPTTTTGAATTTVPTTTAAPPSTSSPATTAAPASQPTLATTDPETSTATTTQPAVPETTAAPTSTKATGKPGPTGTTDDEDVADTKNGKVPPGQTADKRKD